MLPQTHFHRVLNTNHSASSSETCQIHGLLVQPIEELARLNAEIQHLKSTLNYLISQREKLQTFVSSHKALISPIRRLPAEVMSEIFVHCLQTKDRNPTRSLAEAPLLLTLVCRRWREIALSTAQLWSSLHIYLPPTAQKYEIRLTEVINRRAEGVKAWLSRSGSLPLSISLVVGLDRDSSGRAVLVYKSVMDVFFSFSHKWGTLMLRVPSCLLEVIEDYARPHWQDLTRLQTLIIDYDMASRQLLFLDPAAPHPSPEDTNVPLAGLICNAPALRHLTLLEPIQNVYKLDLDWTKLTHFKAETGMNGVQNHEDILRVLSKGALSLQSVTVVAGFHPSGLHAADNCAALEDIIHLPSLHTLSLNLHFEVPLHGLNHDDLTGAGRVYGSQVKAIFDHISTPKLKHLTVRFGNVMSLVAGSIPPQVPFLQFLLWSGCHLESLELGFVMTREALIECLENVPSLTSLTLDECLWTVLRDRQRLSLVEHNAPPTNALATPETIAELAILTDELLQKLLPSSSTEDDEEPTNPSSALCPALQRLALHRCEAVSEMALVKFVQIRARPLDPDSESNTDRSSVRLPLRSLNVTYHREKRKVTEDDIRARKQMKALKRMAHVMISYPRPSLPSDLPDAGQQNPGSLRVWPFRGLLWE
ncbi:hypothetical protein E1B28_001740 [Marasmius oreades]|uniref:F-box domain-containing protein n=1 Tax=Marasmius oreades TaxID=181124 RepID=A0A9P7V484_9AGAR|nr:uncharacterized protein E1B28_001740 [Marasmius oreades]KAG7099947.1 hypothetical protein E1B28_001740 [Marasmius oreades]